MLIRFEVQNFRSILEATELTMLAIDIDRPGVYLEPESELALVSRAGVFGPNASGKSNLLAALGWLRNAVSDSMRSWDEEIPIEPFAFNFETRVSSFVLEMLIDGVRFEYLLDLDAERVHYEALFHYPKGRRRQLFEREGNHLSLQRGLALLSGTRALLTDRILALSIMRRFEEEDTFAFIRAVLSITSLGHLSNRYARFLPAQSTMRLFDDASDQATQLSIAGGWDDRRARALALLRLADLGIEDVRIRKPDPLGDERASYARRVPELVHRSDESLIPFNYQAESTGTRAWFELIGPLLGALDRGAVVLFDELDRSLHPVLTAALLQLFVTDDANPRHAQLIFTAHDSALLNQLGRDEIWLTEKSAGGATQVGPLSDFAGERVRQGQNFERGYRSGRYGALPDVTRPDVLRELGLLG